MEEINLPFVLCLDEVQQQVTSLFPSPSGIAGVIAGPEWETSP